jgi:hypothetical protein
MAGARAAVERRKASALRSARAASDDAAQDLRLSALCLPLFFGGEHFVPFVAKTRMQMHRENEIARTIRPREAGEGDHWSERSERTVVEGAPDAELRCQCNRITAADLFHLRLERNGQAQCQRTTATFLQR